jgi:DNA (cytosine-5)-methyltransferase 1
MNHASLFSGIGGFDLAAHWMGWNNVFNCDIEEFPRKVLKHHFPHAVQYSDIKQTDFTIHAGQIDILSGGFPCQPFSVAGKRLGKNDERHLWPEMYRAIQEIRPKWIVGENVRGLLNWNDGMVLDEVYSDLENEGYEVESFVLPAVGINAPHKRDRVWIIASNSKCISGKAENRVFSEWKSVKSKSINTGSAWNASNATHDRRGGRNSVWGEERWDRMVQGEQAGSQVGSQVEGRSGEQSTGSRKDWIDFPTQSPICGGDDGIPRELDSITFPKWRRESIKAYGNAIVPQIAYRIFKTIDLVEKNL